MASTHPLKAPAREVYSEFSRLVPGAKYIREAVFDVGPGEVRIKRAKAAANQVQVWRGEPVVVFVPSSKRSTGTWHVLSVRWQLRYAKEKPGQAQHASHSFDCMLVPVRDLPGATPPRKLQQVCEAAAREANHPLNKAVVNAIRRSRTAVADVLIDALEPVVDATTPS